MTNYISSAKRVSISSIILACCLFLVCFHPCANTQAKFATQSIAPLPIASEGEDVAMPEIPLKRFQSDKGVIIIDAGHGGDDYGTHSLGTPRYHEKYLNLSTAMLVKGFLQQSGYHVIMTRTDDTFISLEDRANFANKHNPRLFVSIHYNSAPSADAEGIEVFYYRLDDDQNRVAKSNQLARAILSRTLQNTQAKSRGVKHGNYAVIRETEMPAVLIEGGFLTNSDEMEKIKTPAYLKQLSLGIAQGIQDYLAKDRLLADRL